MKKFFVLLLMLFLIAIPAIAQDVVTDETVPEATFSAIKSIFLPAIIAQILVLFADAKKYFLTPEWSTAIFLQTKIWPFLYVTVGGIILYFILVLVPFLKPFIEILTDSPITSLTSASLFGAAAAIVDGFTKDK